MINISYAFCLLKNKIKNNWPYYFSNNTLIRFFSFDNHNHIPFGIGYQSCTFLLFFQNGLCQWSCITQHCLNVLYIGLYIVCSVLFLCIRFFFKIFVITLPSQITEYVFIFRFIKLGYCKAFC